MGVIGNREKKIIKYLLKYGTVNTSQVAEHLELSTKTVSKSIKLMQEELKKINVNLISKPRVGLYLEGELQNISDLYTTSENQIPDSKEERIIYIYTRLLKEENFITMQQLADELYISKGSLEKDLVEVNDFFNRQNIKLSKIPGKGMKLELDEYQRRQVASKIVQLFWADHWYVREEEQGLYPLFETISSNLKGLFPTDQVDKIIQVVSEFSQEKEFRFTDYGFQSLVIHLAIAYERILRGDSIEDAEELVIEENDQLENTRYLIQKLKQRLNIHFPEFETKYINIHLSAESQHTRVVKNPVIDSKEPVDQGLTLLIKEELKNGFYDQALIQDLVTHLNSAIKRIKYGLAIKNPYKDTIRSTFSYSFEKAVTLKKRLEKEYEIAINDDETSYIAIHIQAFLERNDLVDKNQIDVVLVCSSGRGTSQLLAARIRKYFPMIRITRILSVQELLNTKITENLVISTIFLELDDISVIKVSPLLEGDEIELITKRIEEQSLINQLRTDEFKKMITLENIFLNRRETDYQSVLSHIGNHLVERGYSSDEIIASSLKREKASFTSFKGYATPHGNPKDVLKSAIVFVHLEEPIEWGNEQVEFVFFLALKNETPKEMEKIYESLSDILENQQELKRVVTTGQKSVVYNYFRKGVW